MDNYTFADMAKPESGNPENIRQIFDIIASKEKINYAGVSDGFGSHTSEDISDIQRLQYEQVKSNMLDDGTPFQSLEEMEKGIRDNANRILTKDGFYNPMSGIGGSGDPASYDTTYTPVSLSPFETTALYSSGGLSKVIIDKKSKLLLINGYEFSGDITADDAKMLKDYSLRKGFDRALLSGTRDAMIFGGSVLFPYFKKDTPISTSQSLDELLSAGILSKDCIDYFISVDRWNAVVVPNYNITQKDYLFPTEIYVPLGSMKIKTERTALLKPYPQPYWSAIRQLGWSTSDYVGYIREIKSYEIMIQSLAIMFQQMSLLFQIIPLDNDLAMGGPQQVQNMMKVNEDQMKRWSMVQPKALNAVGEIKTIERHYAGMQEMFMIMRQDIASRTTIPESVLFHTSPTGFSDNSDDLKLKQSESIKMIESEIAHNLKNLIKILIISCFGPDHDLIKNNKSVTIEFSTPVVLSDTEKADNGLKFSQSLAQMTQSGIPVDLAVKSMKQFFPNFEMDDEDMERLEESPGPVNNGQSNFGQDSGNLFDMINGKVEK